MFDANADLSADPAENVAVASWWPADDAVAGSGAQVRRRLVGEIQLPVALKPSSRIAHFAVEVCRPPLSFICIEVNESDTDSCTVHRRDSPVQGYRLHACVRGRRAAAQATSRNRDDVREWVPTPTVVRAAAIQRRAGGGTRQLLQRGRAGACMADITGYLTRGIFGLIMARCGKYIAHLGWDRRGTQLTSPQTF